jgi:hypothetical protein
VARDRGARRTRERARRELVRDLERLATLAPGGTPERPLEVASPAQVEPAAAAMPCPLCQGPLHLEEHAAETHAGRRVRVARVRCATCGVRRAVYFALPPPVQ